MISSIILSQQGFGDSAPVEKALVKEADRLVGDEAGFLAHCLA